MNLSQRSCQLLFRNLEQGFISWCHSGFHSLSLPCWPIPTGTGNTNPSFLQKKVTVKRVCQVPEFRNVCEVAARSWSRAQSWDRKSALSNAGLDHPTCSSASPAARLCSLLQSPLGLHSLSTEINPVQRAYGEVARCDPFQPFVICLPFFVSINMSEGFSDSESKGMAVNRPCWGMWSGWEQLLGPIQLHRLRGLCICGCIRHLLIVPSEQLIKWNLQSGIIKKITLFLS